MTARFELAAQHAKMSAAPGETARRCIEQRAMSEVMLRHPEAWTSIDVPQGLRDLVDLNTGIVLVSIHSPNMWLSAALASSRLGDRVTFAVGDESFGQTSDGAASARGDTRSGPGESKLIRATDAYLVMRRQLGEGGAVGVMFDVPGRVSVNMLGKRTYIHPWFAKLARRHGSVIVPSLGVWSAGTFRMFIGDAVSPRPGETVAEICQRTANSIEMLWSAHPQAWAPYSGKLWLDDVEPYRWAFDDVWDEA